MVKITFVINFFLATYDIIELIAKGVNKVLYQVPYCGNNDDGYGGWFWVVQLGITLSGVGLSLILKSLGFF